MIKNFDIYGGEHSKYNRSITSCKLCEVLGSIGRSVWSQKRKQIGLQQVYVNVCAEKWKIQKILMIRTFYSMTTLPAALDGLASTNAKNVTSDFSKSTCSFKLNHSKMVCCETILIWTDFYQININNRSSIIRFNKSIISTILK